MGPLSQSLLLALSAAAVVHAEEFPAFPFAEDTTPFCSWWTDYYGGKSCARLLQDEYIELEDFLRWNPSLSGPECEGLTADRSYCVEAFGEPEPSSTESPTTITSTVSSTPFTTSTTSTSTTTTPGNGISTPLPTQPGMVDNCDKFHFVQDGESCTTVLEKNDISMDDLLAWNPSVIEDCTGLWGEVNVCVNIIGHTPSPDPTTTSTPTNLPSPIQTPVASNCNRYHKVASKSTTCQAIADYWGVKLDDLKSWNPSLDSTCSNLKVGHHVCAGVLPAPIMAPVAENCNRYHKVGSSSTTCKAIAEYNDIELSDLFKWNPSIVNPGCDNLVPSSHVCIGVLPSPIQAPVAVNCNKYHQVGSTSTTCQAIADYNNIRIADFFKWNPSIASPDCTNLWVKYYVCVGVPGAVEATPTDEPTPKPTSTKPSNGVATPTPIQPNMTKNCKSFHLAEHDTTTCQGIADYRKISLDNFYKWNPDVGSKCTGLWKGYHYCYAVL